MFFQVIIALDIVSNIAIAKHNAVQCSNKTKIIIKNEKLAFYNLRFFKKCFYYIELTWMPFFYKIKRSTDDKISYCLHFKKLIFNNLINLV